MKTKEEILEISIEFASGFKDTVGQIAGSGWLIVDPLSGYLNAIGINNTLEQLPANDDHGLVLIMTFEDGSKLIPAGSDLKKVFPFAINWMWINASTPSTEPKPQ